MINGVDCYGPLPTAALKPFGFIGRYVSAQEGKCVNAQEFTEYVAAGLQVVLVYEDGAYDSLGGELAGKQKAHIAAPVLASIGWPASRPVYIAADFSSTGNQSQIVLECAQAFAAELGTPVAIYGDANTCAYALSNGVKYVWQFGYDGNNVREPINGASIYQNYPWVTVNDMPCDPDIALVRDFGQYPFYIQEEAEMFIRNTKTGEIDFVSGGKRYDIGEHGDGWGEVLASAAAQGLTAPLLVEDSGILFATFPAA